MNRILINKLVLCIIVGLCAQINMRASINYKVISEIDATCEVTTGNYSGSITIPETATISGKKYRVIGIGQDAFREAPITSLIMSDNIQYIRSYALYDASQLAYVKLSDNISTISQYTFRGCRKLTNIELPKKLKSIDWAGFEYTGLTTISIPFNTTNLDRWAFTSNESLGTIFLSENSNLTIAGDTFNRCPNITDIYVKAQNPPVFTGDNFDNYNATVHVPMGSKQKYLSAEVWKKFNIVEMDENGHDVIKVASITLTPSQLNLKIGEQSQLTCQVMPYNASNNAVSWSSSNSNVVQVDEKGHIIAKSVGEAHIFCSSTDGSSISAKCKVTVSPQIATSIAISPDYVVLEIGESIQLKANIFPFELSGQVVQWSSSDDNTVIVTSTGKLYALAKGEASITAQTSDGSNLTAECKVIIKGIDYKIISDTEGTCEVVAGDYTGDVVVPQATLIDGLYYRVIGIGESAFSNCEVTSVKLNNGLEFIDRNAFAECRKLKSITIPRTVKDIADDAFVWCGSLQTMTVESGNNTYDSRENCNAIIHTSSNTLVAGCNGTVIPSSVTNIWPSAFLGCIGLKQISIPSGVKLIRQSTFEECKGLKQVLLPNSLTYIGNSAFYGCQSLTEIRLPSSLETIDENAFLGCLSLKELIIPNHVTSIGDDAFDECPGILKLTLPASLTQLGDEAFADCVNLKEIHSKVANLFPFNRDVFGFVNKSKCKLFVPHGMVEDYRNHLVWGEFLNILEDTDSSGDVNADGKIDVDDINILVNIMLAKANAENYNGRANVDGQGLVDVNDINVLLNIILGK